MATQAFSLKQNLSRGRHAFWWFNLLCSEQGLSLQNCLSPQLRNNFASEFAWRLSLTKERWKGRGRGCPEGGCTSCLITAEERCSGRTRRKVHFKNNRTFQREYIRLIEKRLEAVIFIPPNAESFFKQFHKINKREVVLS